MWSLATLFSSSLFLLNLPATLAISNDASVTSTNNSVDMVAAAWFAGWHADKGFAVANVSWEKYTHMTYSFATTLPDVHNLSLADSEEEVLPQFVQTAHENGVKALVSVGGWTGSLYYSSNVATADNRTAFVKTITDLATKYNLDGIDFDWEYPGNQGIGCNIVNGNDTTNFLLFLQELRRDPVGEKLILTAATSIFPWKDVNGNPLANVTGFAEALDYVAIMNYDIWGAWSTAVGPNAPLNDTCAAPANQQGSAVSAVAAWMTAGMPAHKIVLGVASYGHSFNVNPDDAFECDDDQDVLVAYPPFDKSKQPVGDAWDDTTVGTDVCGNPTGPAGNFDFWGLIQGGFLFENGTVAEGIAYRFDECSQTAYVYDETSQVMVSFDDAAAFKAKGEFIQSMGLRGFAMWEAGGDFNDILLDSISVATGMELPDDCGDGQSGVLAPVQSSTGSSPAKTSTPAPSEGSGSGSGNGNGNGSGSGSGGHVSTSTRSGSGGSGLNNGGGNTNTAPAAPVKQPSAPSEPNTPAQPANGTPTVSSSHPTATSGSSAPGDDEDCGDDEGDEPVDDGDDDGDDEDDCEDDEPETTSAAPAHEATPTSKGGNNGASVPSPVITSAVATPTESAPTDGEDDGDDCTDEPETSSATEATASVTVISTTSAPSEIISASSSVVSSLIATSEAVSETPLPTSTDAASSSVVTSVASSSAAVSSSADVVSTSVKASATPTTVEASTSVVVTSSADASESIETASASASSSAAAHTLAPSLISESSSASASVSTEHPHPSTSIKVEPTPVATEDAMPIATSSAPAQTNTHVDAETPSSAPVETSTAPAPATTHPTATTPPADKAQPSQASDDYGETDKQ